MRHEGERLVTNEVLVSRAWRWTLSPYPWLLDPCLIPMPHALCLHAISRVSVTNRCVGSAPQPLR